MIIQTDKPLAPRREHDYYPTPYALCEAVINLVPNYAPIKRIFDPGCGDGVWGRAAKARWPNAQIDGSDIRPVRQLYGDKLSVYGNIWGNYLLSGDGFTRYDLVVGNPPYKDAEAFVRKSLRLCSTGSYVIFLLRLAFLESQTRARGLWREHPPTSVYVLGKRPSFTGNGKTDATAYAIYVWRAGSSSQTTLHWLNW